MAAGVFHRIVYTAVCSLLNLLPFIEDRLLVVRNSNEKFIMLSFLTLRTFCMFHEMFDYNTCNIILIISTQSCTILVGVNDCNPDT